MSISRMCAPQLRSNRARPRPDNGSCLHPIWIEQTPPLLAAPDGSTSEGRVEDAETSGLRAAGTAGIAGVAARRAAHLTLDHSLRVYVVTDAFGFYPAFGAAHSATAT